MTLEKKRYSHKRAFVESEKLKNEMRMGLAKNYVEANENIEKDKKENRVMRMLEAKYGKGLDRASMYPLMNRLEKLYGSLDGVRGKRILELGCGSIMPQEAKLLARQSMNLIRSGIRDKESLKQIERELLDMQRRTPTFSYDMYMNAREPLSETQIRNFEPWFPRLLLGIGAHPVGIDIGDLHDEEFEHYTFDLSKKDALSFLPDKSFDAVHMRLFTSSPQLEEITDKKRRDELNQELARQISRLLKDGGKIIELDPEVQRELSKLTRL